MNHSNGDRIDRLETLAEMQQHMEEMQAEVRGLQIGTAIFWNNWPMFADKGARLN